MSEVRSLGYLGFAGDAEAWTDWATGVLGLQPASGPPGGKADRYFRMDDRSWRFAVHDAPAGAHLYTGWEVADADGLERLRARLVGAGVDVRDDGELAAERGVEAAFSCHDPDGSRLEFFHSAYSAVEPFVSPHGVRFVTGDQGLGHILHFVSDERRTSDFYLGLLGFRVSDFIRFGSNKVVFTHVNRRHHSLAFVQADRTAALGHFMVEADTIDAVGFALDRVNAGMATLTETFGRHTNDRMLSFYMMNPSGSQAEFGYGGRQIDDGWVPVTYSATAYWGHKVPGSEYSADGPRSPREA